ncbi:MAG: ABC transporter ATP-binding protein [Promethearchaeota archaeon]
MITTTQEKKQDTFVRFENVTKKFGSFTAVSDVSFDIYKGEVLGFLGPNGAGKSTTMKMLARLQRPTSGSVYIRGNGHLEELNITNKDYLLNSVGFLIENPNFYGNMSPREILSYFAELKGYPKSKVKKRVEEVVALVDLSDWIDIKMKTFSKGMRQKIGIVSAIVHDPDIIVLDEPHTGLDPKARTEIRAFILKLKEMGKTVFFSSHLLYEVSEVSDRVAIISKGKIIALDTLENLERLAQGSIIELELHNFEIEQKEEILTQLRDVLEPLSGLPAEDNKIIFNNDSQQFEILFNGNPDNQYAMSQALYENKFKVLGFSVPRADLLEDLYLKFMEEEETEEMHRNGAKSARVSA